MEYLYDTHFHLDLQKDRVAAIREIEEHQIYTIAVTNLPDLYRREAGEIASKYIRLALGFHPELIHQYKNQIPLMWELLPEVHYIGEVGLDFVDTTYKNEQIAFFSELIERCRFDRNKIITLHSRRAVRQVLDIIGNNFRFKPIFHWFTGSKEELLNAVEKGCYFSVNKSMMNTKKFQSMLSLIPDERLLFETDSPFTSFSHSHHETLTKISQLIKEKKENVNMWNNFKIVLGTRI
ncbi:hydrolase [Porphyromonas macacae]|uniref:TatD family hydrolase n=1 Tax=Porphyromonas macacae TaxID=28115 RepID=UPI00052C48EE|nr:TatD family hydrolase [Porphyromonas macacae]KGN99754.1 hydrolase [Porphyromonas macacae]